MGFLRDLYDRLHWDYDIVSCVFDDLVHKLFNIYGKGKHCDITCCQFLLSTRITSWTTLRIPFLTSPSPPLHTTIGLSYNPNLFPVLPPTLHSHSCLPPHVANIPLWAIHWFPQSSQSKPVVFQAYRDLPAWEIDQLWYVNWGLRNGSQQRCL